MADMCSVMITGRLTADSELKYTNNGTAILKFSVAVGRYEKGQTETSYFDVVQWGKAGESLSSRLTKGKPVVVRGEMRQEFWNANDGTKRSKWVLVADAYGVQPLYAPSDEEPPQSAGSGYRGSSNNSYTKPQYSDPYDSGLDDEEIPF